MKIISKNILGVLWLDEEIEIQKKGEIGSDETYGCSVIIEPVPNASVARVLAGDDSLIKNFIESGKKLIERGATAITSACGFTIRYQKQISSALNVPVAASSLLLAPYLALIYDYIGVVTFDARALKLNDLMYAGIGKKDLPRFKIVGVENTKTWISMATYEIKRNDEIMKKDVTNAITQLLVKFPDIKCILLECHGFPSARGYLSNIFKMPVYDAVLSVKLLLSSLPREDNNF